MRKQIQSGRTANMRFSLMAAAIACLAFTACSSVDQDIQEELKAATAGIQGSIQPLPTAKPYTPYNYEVGDKPDPFGEAKAQLAARAGEKNSVQEPDLQRQRGALEAFPLESLTFNGTFVKNGTVSALISTEGNLYTVKIGEFVGQNYGRIVKITEEQVDLVEKVQDPSGVWVERNSSLTLQGQ